MKILFVCGSISRELLNIADALKSYDIEVDILDIVSYEFLYHSGKRIYIRPKSRYKVLEYFFILDEINEFHRRREIFDYLNRYDSVHIYKAGYFAKYFKDKLEVITTRYVITPCDTMIKQSLKLDKLFEDATGFVFFDEISKNRYKKLYGYDFINQLFYQPVKLFKLYDKIESDIFEKFKNYLQIDSKKTNIFCMFSGSKIKQRDLLVKLVNLPVDIKQKSTFILYFKDKDDDFTKRLLHFLEDMRLDFVVMSKDAQKEQVAMAIKASKASIFIDCEIYNKLLLLSLYGKKHVFLFEPKEIDGLFRSRKIFMDDFEQFYFFYKENDMNSSIYKEIFDRNKEQIKSLFHPDSFSERYLKFLVEKT